MQADQCVQEEISEIVKKRSHFEHVLNARGSSPADYARYAEWEMNLESLRRRRVRRKGIKASGFSGRPRIFAILDRGTRKFHGDLALWMQYIGYARKQKAHKKLMQILTDVLRLHPTKPELWIYVADYHFSAQGDMKSARSTIQRGLRFCKTSRTMWLEYAKLEMNYLAKIAARQHILGLEESTAPEVEEMPRETEHAERIDPSTAGTSELNLDTSGTTPQSIASTPLLNGAIPIAIFDGAMTQFESDRELAMEFFGIFADADYAQVPSRLKVLRHILNVLTASDREDSRTVICSTHLKFVECVSEGNNVPREISLCLELFRLMTTRSPQCRAVVAADAVLALVRYLPEKHLDRDVRKVVRASLKRFVTMVDEDSSTAAERNSKRKETLIKALQRRGYESHMRACNLWFPMTADEAKE